MNTLKPVETQTMSPTILHEQVMSSYFTSALTELVKERIQLGK